LRRVAEEMRLRDRHLVQQGLSFAAAFRARKQREVRRNALGFRRGHPLRDAVAQRLATRLVEGQSRRVVQETRDCGELRVGERDPAHRGPLFTLPDAGVSNGWTVSQICGSGSWRSTASAETAAAGIPYTALVDSSCPIV